MGHKGGEFTILETWQKVFRILFTYQYHGIFRVGLIKNINLIFRDENPFGDF